MGIVEEDIARVRAATDFVGLVGEHLALKRVGRSWQGLCPFHSEKSPSFNVNAEQGLYYCYGCQAGGDAINFVKDIEHLDFAAAVEYLAGRAGITVRYDDAQTGRDHQQRTRIHETLEQAVEWYHQRLLTSDDAAAARRYLRTERGYDGDVVRRYRLGWAPDGWRELVRALKVPPAALADAGLAYVNDRGSYTDFFRERLLFPIFEPSGRPVGAGGRMLPGGRAPKYKNTSNTAVYDKSRTLYGLNWAKEAVVKSGQVVVCEGYTDVIGLHRVGVGEAVATCGTALADGHIRALTNFARRIVLAYDADGAGQAAADKVAEWEQRFEVDIRVAALPPGADPADLARSDPDALKAAVAEAKPFMAFRLQRLFGRADLSSAEGRVRAATEAAAMVAAHPNELVRDQYLMEVADRCRVDPSRLRQVSAAGAASGSGPAGRGGSGGRGSGGGAGGYSRDRGDRGGRYQEDRYGGDRYRDGRPGRPDPGPGDDPDSGGAELLAAVSAVERQALSLAIHERDAVADRLDSVLFAHPVARTGFVALCECETVHEAIEGADPQTAMLLQRAAVERDEVPVDSVVIRLVERAVGQAVDELRDEWRADSLARPGAGLDGSYTSYSENIAWLKLELEALRTTESEGDAQGARDAEDRLVTWLIDREESRHGGSAHDDVDDGGAAIRDDDGPGVSHDDREADGTEEGRGPAEHMSEASW